MSRNILTKCDLDLLGQIELDADIPLTTVARRLGRHSMVVQRHVQRLIERGVILGRTAVFDTSRVGVIEYGFFLVLGPRTEKLRSKFLTYLKSRPGVSWVAEVGGEFDLAINVLARHPGDILSLFDACGATFPGLIVRKEMVQRTTRIRCYRGYLGGRYGVRFRSGESAHDLVLSESEVRIIRSLDALGFESYRELAQRCEISVPTFTRIIRHFKQVGFLKGLGYRLDTELLGRMQFRMMIAFKHLPPSSIEAMLNLAPRIEGVKLLVRCLGPWDFEMEYDAISHRAAREMSARIWATFGDDLSSVRVIPIFEHVRYVSFGTHLLLNKGTDRAHSG
jgi:DNA-binding Lrp family transcriptional regulator